MGASIVRPVAGESFLHLEYRYNTDWRHPAFAFMFLLVQFNVAALSPSGTCGSVQSMSCDQMSALLRQRWESRIEEADPGSLGGCSAGMWATRCLFAARLPGLPLKCCHLADSHIPGAGRGLFASEDIVTGSLITLYPGDAIRIDAVLTGFNFVTCAAASPDGSSLSLPDATLLDRARSYEIEIESRIVSDGGEAPVTSLLGDPDLVDDRAYLGHMLNDGATCSSEACRAAYTAESLATRNTEPMCLQGCHLGIVATRDIERGDELLLSYGAPYWLAQHQPNVRPSWHAATDPDDDWGCGSSQKPRRGRMQRGGALANEQVGVVTSRRARGGRSGTLRRASSLEAEFGEQLADEAWGEEEVHTRQGRGRRRRPSQKR